MNYLYCVSGTNILVAQCFLKSCELIWCRLCKSCFVVVRTCSMLLHLNCWDTSANSIIILIAIATTLTWNTMFTAFHHVSAWSRSDATDVHVMSCRHLFSLSMDQKVVMGLLYLVPTLILHNRITTCIQLAHNLQLRCLSLFQFNSRQKTFAMNALWTIFATLLASATTLLQS